MSIDQKTYRNALGCFATGITVITTKGAKDEQIGVTINSFASVSLEPPMVLFSLKSESLLNQFFKDSEVYNVNILAEGQEEISNLFAGPAEDKFDQVSWREGVNGAPILNNILASLECKLVTAYEGGDHIIYLGEVTKINCPGDEGKPLLYFRGSYEAL